MRRVPRRSFANTSPQTVTLSVSAPSSRSGVSSLGWNALPVTSRTVDCSSARPGISTDPFTLFSRNTRGAGGAFSWICRSTSAASTVASHCSVTRGRTPVHRPMRASSRPAKSICVSKSAPWYTQTVTCSPSTCACAPERYPFTGRPSSRSSRASASTASGVRHVYENRPCNWSAKPGNSGPSDAARRPRTSVGT